MPRTAARRDDSSGGTSSASPGHLNPEGRAPGVPLPRNIRPTQSSVRLRKTGTPGARPSGLMIPKNPFIHPLFSRPPQHIQLPLPPPLLRLLDQPRPHWILHHISPFFRITLPAPQIPIEKILLPNRLLLQPRPTPCRTRPPCLHPPLQGVSTTLGAQKKCK
jgi:hypothetical protein